MSKTTAIDQHRLSRQTVKDSESNKLMGTSEVVMLAGFSTGTLYRLMRNGVFPKPHRLPGIQAKFWNRRDVEEWVTKFRAIGKAAQ